MIEGKVEIMVAAVVAAEFVPIMPFGKQAITMLCLPIDPSVYVWGHCLASRVLDEYCRAWQLLQFAL